MEVDPENKESDLSEEEGVLEVNGDMKDKIKKKWWRRQRRTRKYP